MIGPSAPGLAQVHDESVSRKHRSTIEWYFHRSTFYTNDAFFFDVCLLVDFCSLPGSRACLQTHNSRTLAARWNLLLLLLLLLKRRLLPKQELLLFMAYTTNSAGTCQPAHPPLPTSPCLSPPLVFFLRGRNKK